MATAAHMEFGTDNYEFEYTGYGIFVSFADLPSDEGWTGFKAPRFAIKSVTDAGFEAGDPIDITTNATKGLREQAPADLASPSEISMTVAYNLDDIELCYKMLGVPCTVIIEYRKCSNRVRGRKRTYKNAYLKSFTPGDASEGAAPEATVTIGLAGGYHTDTAPEGFNPAGVVEALAQV